MGYCKQSNLDCEICTLSKNDKDCHDNPIDGHTQIRCSWKHSKMLHILADNERRSKTGQLEIILEMEYDKYLSSKNPKKDKTKSTRK
jgi:hypothetical protein